MQDHIPLPVSYTHLDVYKRQAYDIEGAVEHNALTDAHDLMRIHQASLKRNPNPEAVRGIVERKLAKQQEVARKQQEKLFHIMKERFSPYDTLECSITLYPEIVEQFHLWEERCLLYTSRCV